MMMVVILLSKIILQKSSSVLSIGPEANNELILFMSILFVICNILP